jgi:CRP-like cAMP-binding protein
LSPRDRLRSYLAARARLSAPEIQSVLAEFVPRRLAKGAFLLRPGDDARFVAFVTRGCLRSYVVDEKGKAHVLRFAPEEWWIADSTRFLAGTEGGVFIDAIEPSEVLLIGDAAHRRTEERLPAFAAAYRRGLERLAAALQKRIVLSLTASAEKRYLDFVAEYPMLVRRVPLRILAAYLGMTPETLSRVRRRLATNPRIS